jgi:hypothetical protein
MTLILDGTSPTGAWSMFRDLLTSFIGGTRYTTGTGVNSLNDQSGNARHFINAIAASQPAVTTAGPNSRTCADFDGVDDVLASSVVLSNYFTAAAGYLVVTFIADAITANNATSYNNNTIIGGQSGYMGLYLRNTGTPATIMAGNYDGTDDHADIAAAITTGTVYVAEWRHDTGNVYVRLNGGTEVSVASGNTQNIGLGFYLGQGFAAWGNIKFFEMATWSTVPALATRNAIVADFMGQVVTPAGRAKVWNGAAWVLKPAKVWSGSAWLAKPVKVWNGSVWR